MSENLRQSARQQGVPPEFDGLPPIIRRRRPPSPPPPRPPPEEPSGQSANESSELEEGELEEEEVEEEELREESRVEGRAEHTSAAHNREESRDRHRHESGASSRSSNNISPVARFQRELESLRLVDELQSQIEAIKMQKLERLVTIAEKRRELQQAEDNASSLEYWEPSEERGWPKRGDTPERNNDEKIATELKSTMAKDRSRKATVNIEAGQPDSAPLMIAAPTTDHKPGTPGTSAPKGENNFKLYLARQTVAKELPLFFGDPVEWPRFIAHYRSSTEACQFSNVENMARLEKALKGKAKEAVQCMLAVPEKVEAVITRLEKNFGRPDLILKILTERAEKMHNVRDEKPEGLMEFANAIENLTSTAEVLKKKEYLANPYLMEKLVEKLSPGMKRDWGTRAKAIPDGVKKLEEFASWITIVAEEVAIVSSPQTSSVKREEKEQPKARAGRRGNVFASFEEKKCFFCLRNHSINICREFAKKSSDDRWKWAAEQKLCFSCLGSQHWATICTKKKKCGKEGCEKLHHPLLHWAVSKAIDEPKIVSHTHSVDEIPQSEIPLCVLPVTVTGKRGKIETFAMLDCGSSVTLIDADIAAKIGASGLKRTLRLQWINADTETAMESMNVSLKIKGSRCREMYYVNSAQTVKNLCLPTENLDVRKAKRKWPHLRGTHLVNLYNATPRVLIGLNNANLIVPLVVIEGRGNEPIAVKTRLGWCLFGKTNNYKDRVDSGFVHHIYRNPDDALHQMVKDSFRIEDLGVRISPDNLMSKEEKRTKYITENTTRRIEGGWETGLLWKEDNIVLPESKTMALNRLYGIERKLDKNEIFANSYCKKIQEYIDKGFARKLTSAEVSKPHPRIWYLPHFAVFNPNKPNKLRLVFDAAAKSRGVSLNDKLLKGVDLLKPLPSVLCKFRQRNVGFVADIKDMFHRVKIIEADLPAQRFLWRGMERGLPPDEYQMDVMIFGAASSPYSAQEVKNRNALTLQPPPSENAIQAIVERHYMDDYLDSCNTVQEAQELAMEVIEVHKKGGFHICNWISSHTEFLDTIPVTLRAAQKETVDLGANASEEIETERVLGLHWNPTKDVFQFTTKLKKVNADIMNGNKTPTKREALSVIMSVFDPLGFLTNLVIKAKILLQDVWRIKIGWDDVLVDEPHEKWKKWLTELQEIKNFEIPRCYFSKINENTKISMHIFCDASEQAFAAVAYLLLENDSEIETAFVMAKSKVAPLRPESIPRLELQAALLGSRMNKIIREYHEIVISETHFWTDSRTVLCWLRSDGRRFKPFVAHRIGEILEDTDIKYWHWLPSKENVADEATRDNSRADIYPRSRWLLGPEFLLQPAEYWPVEVKTDNPREGINEQDLEEKGGFAAVITDKKGKKKVKIELFPEIGRFSSWLKLIRTTAWIRRYLRKRYMKSTELFGKELSVAEMDSAELKWLLKVQKESFPEELKCCLKGERLPRSSRLKRLVPTLDDQGLIVLRGRIQAATNAEAPSYLPIILDPEHSYTKLLLQHFHAKAGHHGTERVLNEVRQKYWVLNGRTALKRTLRNCQMCKVRKVKPTEPEMGMLPHFRVNPQPRPFMYTGLDYFGPYEVTIGRRHEKRYGALFTCLTTRAVHLELAGSLNTDSCIMALRRFMARRGAPKEIWSDNGTNFHGANNELKKSIQELNQEQIAGELVVKGVDWKFIPPSAPHMGGAWERLVGAMKTALNAVLKSRTPKEEILQTLLAEAEYSVNSRPLTHVSDDPGDLESLTPNHFLLGGTGGVRPFGNYSDHDMFSRKQWRMSQRLADMFWQRWVKEYLPTLTRRTKDSSPRKSLEVGDLVFIADGDLKRNYWPRGVIENVFPGKDGIVRVVEIRTNHGTFRRPVVKVGVIDVKKVEVDVP